MLLENCSDRDVDMVFAEEAAGTVLLARCSGRGTPLISSSACQSVRARDARLESCTWIWTCELASVVHLCPHPPAGQACLRRACSTLETTRRFCRPRGFYFWRLAPLKRSGCGDVTLAVGLNQQLRQSNLSDLRVFFVDVRAGFGVRLRVLRRGQPCGEDSTCRFLDFDRTSATGCPQ